MAALRGHGGTPEVRRETGDGRRAITAPVFLIFSLVFGCARIATPPSPAPRPETPPPVAAPVATVRGTAVSTTFGSISGGAGQLSVHIVGSGADTVLVPLASWLEP